jgi:hypothetical protein
VETALNRIANPHLQHQRFYGLWIMSEQRHEDPPGSVRDPMALLPALHGAQRKIEGRGELFWRHSKALAKGLNLLPGAQTQRP